MVATERLGRATGWVEASGQESAVGRAATLQAVTRVKPEQASKVKSWMPTRLLTGEGRANREETDRHLFGPPGYTTLEARPLPTKTRATSRQDSPPAPNPPLISL